MPNYLAPGVYMEETSSGIRPIEGVSTSVAAFIGVTQKGPVGKATLVTNLAEFKKLFGGPIKIVPGSQEHYLYYTVRHFFRQGGQKCYVVRIVHYKDPDQDDHDAGSSLLSIPSQSALGGGEGPGIVVSAINGGKWGDGISVRTRNSSRFSVLLKEDVLGSTVDRITLADNTDVKVGSLLYVVEEFYGVVSSVDLSAKTVTILNKLRTGVDDYTVSPIPSGTKVFTPDFGLGTETVGQVTLDSGVPAGPITLDSLSKSDGSNLKVGDVLNFVRSGQESIFVVKAVGSKTIGTLTAMVAEFGSQNNFPVFSMNHSRVYARDFTLDVKVDDEIVETHEHLSLVDSDTADHAGNRLRKERGQSFYITIVDHTPPNEVVIVDQAYTALAGGDDGITGLGGADFMGSELLKTGIHALDRIDDASILCIPNASKEVAADAVAYCDKRKDLFYILDQPSSDTNTILQYRQKFSSQYAAVYDPWILDEDPFTKRPIPMPPSGAMAGIYAHTDIKRGVHHAPAGIDVGRVTVARGVTAEITKGRADILYQKEVNPIRKLREGIAVWGARTLSADPEWKYINVRRLFIFLEQSILRGTSWVPFEPNDATLWKSIERNVSAFLYIQWLEGKLVGAVQEEAFYGKCNEETNPQEVVDAGYVI
ncbi:MAG: phage tail sheath subtilisin-like domain-containing protein, partial [Planctomycetota bacterium]